LHPPEKAVVLCVDEKPQVQALERTAPVLPVRPGPGSGVIHGCSCTSPPTSGSWLNLVEAFVSIITRQALRRGNFPTVVDLIAAIGRFIDAWNDRCAPSPGPRTPAMTSRAAHQPRIR
jgi:hypothetical protein